MRRLLPVLGEKRFKKFIDFTAKVDSWKVKNLAEPDIQQFASQKRRFDVLVRSPKKSANIWNMISWEVSEIQ